MSFIYGTKLAKLQDRTFEDIVNGKSVNPKIYKKLKENLWITLSEKIAPNNLVVRNYCVLDLLNKSCFNYEKIYKLCCILSNETIWLEGYSYWLYTKRFLKEYYSKCLLDRNRGLALALLINKIDSSFADTAYKRGDKLYPAPYGDLRDQPLVYSLQDEDPTPTCRKSLVVKDYPRYYIKPAPLGFNLHTPSKESTYVINGEGFPESYDGKIFQWYTEYKNKYPSFLHEIRDMMNFRRILSIIRGYR